MKKINKLYIIIATIVIIIGAILCNVKGFNIELEYLNRQEIDISISKEMDIQKIKEISKSVLNEKKFKVKKLGIFKNSIKIMAEEITPEEKENLINKINEEYNVELSIDEIDILKIPNTRIRDVIKPYILPGLITFIIIIIYFIIIYNKIGFMEVIAKSILLPIFTELTYYSVIVITRIPFGRITNSIAIGVYIVCILALTSYFQKEKTIKNSEKEKDE